MPRLLAVATISPSGLTRFGFEIASRMGPFDGYQVNRAPMIGVIAKHRAAVGNIENDDVVPADLLAACRKAWDDALNLGELHGYRNAQASVLAPPGTISFMMDCDTTGVEPDFSLVKSKKLVGGGEITIVNKTVPMALEKLGYAPREVEEIVAYVDERNTVVGAPQVIGDRDQLLRVVRNLVDNAIAYNRPGGSVEIRLTPDSIWAVVAVEDTGMGIPEPRRHGCSSASTAGRQRGGEARTGWAWVWRSCSIWHGSTVTVSSEAGAGSTFTVRLPLAPETAGTMPEHLDPVTRQ